MFSVLSRLTKPNDGKKSNAPPPMSSSLQKKFSKGVDYNMKILIKGDRNVGKSCLLQRLQGGPFIEEYTPTDQIQIAPIHWKYKDTEHIIKVEVWEVVDKGKVKKKASNSLKFENSSVSPEIDAIETPPLDATFLDVYVNANGVIMMMDITKPWTFEYIKREISTIPPDIPIIILGNHCDMHHHREINLYQIEQFLLNTKQLRTAAVRYAESSMRNGFGLRLLHKFLNIPFLQLQRNTLLNQLSVNKQEMNNAFEELDEFEQSDVTNYELFLERLTTKRNQENGSNLSHKPRIASDKTPSIVLGAGKPIIPPNINPLIQSQMTMMPNKQVNTSLQSVNSNINKISSNLTKNSVSSETLNQKPLHSQHNNITSTPPSVIKNKDDIDDFCPGDLDHSFLEDLSPTNKNFNGSGLSVPNYNMPVSSNIDSDSCEEDGKNPLVAGIQDDLDSSDENEKLKRNNDSNTLTSESYKLNSLRVVEKVVDKSHTFNDDKRNESDCISYDQNIPKILLDKQLESQYKNIHKNCPTNVVHKVIESDQYDSSYEIHQPINYDSSPTWPLDSSVRRSPEGGEGIPSNSEMKKEDKPKEEKKHKKSKKSSKDKKEKEGDRNKEKKHKEKKHRKKRSDEYMEDFLNDVSNKPDEAREAYETF